jgi:hypothetical protein
MGMARLAFLVATLMFAVGCARTHFQPAPLPPGVIAQAVWKDCVMPSPAMIDCRCSKFSVALDAKSRKSIISCIEERHD